MPDGTPFRQSLVRTSVIDTQRVIARGEDGS